MSSELAMWIGGVVLLTASCGAAQVNSSTVELPAEVGELPPQLEAAYRVFAINCSKCHGLERPLTAPVSDHGHWERYVARMMRTPSSGISATEGPIILSFLFWYTDKKNGRPTQYDLPESAPIVEAAEPAAPQAPAVESSEAADSQQEASP